MSDLRDAVPPPPGVAHPPGAAHPPAPPRPRPGPSTRPRLESIDALRGLVMIIMAIDHVRDFVHRGAMSGSPTNLATTTPILFMTRWVTHICAPAFMLTAGLGAFLWWQRGRTRTQLSVFLLTRGAWLMLLEITVMRLAYDFDLGSPYPVFLLVLWALGLCMIGLAALVWLPIPALATLSLAVIVLHNLLDGVSADRFGSAAPVWNLLHQPGAFPVGGTTVIAGYQLIPWIAVMALGFCAGSLFLMERPRRRRILVTIGAAAIVWFIAERAINGYGDPSPWAAQPSPVYTVLSFLNTTKYPPSLDFLLMTLGPALLLLAWLDRPGLKPSNPLLVFGRVPLFYFVVHFYLAHLAAVFLAFLRYGGSARAFAFHRLPSLGAPAELFPPGFGEDLWVVYVVWAVIVVGLYPVCRWFGELKARRREWWLSYL
jgi:uncharacterized membrane protein